ncbi:hypothetical protein JKF63_04565 [Porcisia hertigi]|uniref:Alpha-type protein kinase domain-containing protein n=1 Tax=Porcisia hertigi TaxID=2761500 RepID=A0A836HN07_9TRYP|nr:hypothetical protein JKF63_04565 [Porcisia hertigi]
MGDIRDRVPTSPVQLPLITRPVTSASSSLQVRQFAADIMDANALGFANVPSTPSCSSSHTSIHYNDRDASCAPALANLVEASTAVGRPLHSVPLPTRTPKRGGTSPNELSCPSTPRFSRHGAAMDMDSMADVKTEEHLSNVLGTSDLVGCASIFAKAPALLTGRVTPPTLTDDATGQWSLRNSGAMGASTAASPAANSTVASPLANSGPNHLGIAFPGNGECASQGAQPQTGNLFNVPRQESIESFNRDNCSTAARGTAGQQPPSDSFEHDDAVHRRRAKRRLKKLQDEGRADHRRSSGAAAKGPDQLASEEARAGAAGHKSDSAIARKRKRKQQQRLERMKRMSSEERRQYKERHQLRRAAKKAMRASAAAVTSNVERSDGLHRSGSKQHDSGSLPLTQCPTGVREQNPSPVAAIPADPDAPFTGLRPRESSLNSDIEPSTLDLCDRASVEGFASTLAPQVLANTCSAPVTAPTDDGKDLMYVHQARRCTSASGGGVPVSIITGSTAKWLPDTPAFFHRRALSNADPTKRQRERQSSLAHLASSVPSNVCAQEGPLQAHDGEAQACDVDREPVLEANGSSEDDYDEDKSRGPVRGRPIDDSGAFADVCPERAPRFNSNARSPTPQPPPAAAGSGAAAILELKQKHELEQQRRSPAPSPAAGAGHPAALSSVANINHDSDLVDAGKVPSGTSIAPGCGAHYPHGPSLLLRPEAGVSDTVEPDPKASSTGAADMSASLASYGFFPRRLRARDEDRAAVEPAVTSAGSSGKHDGAEIAPTAAIASSPPTAAAESAAARKARQTPPSSCSSFRSRISDDESGVGSSEYSYSSYTSSGSLVPEVLPLVEGCSVPPPAAAFSDLNYRYSCVPLLRNYAEPGIIHEWNLMEGCWGSVETSVVFDPKPFAQGNMRASYHMIDMGRLNCLLVAKRYLKASVREDQYFDDVSMHSIAGHWARVFNTMGPPKKVRFVPAAVLVLPKRDPPLVLAMEPQLTGKFVKYNNNCGYVRRKARWTPQAFSHFTYHASEHELMVVDIQGVDDYYTDPQILSSDGEGYGRGNLGKEGIRRFLESHKCNEVCRAVGLPPLQRNAKGRVIAPLASSGSARGSAAPGTPSGTDWLTTVGPSASGLKEERLPPKAFLASRRSSSGSVPGHEHSNLQIGLWQPNEAAMSLSPALPPRQSLPSSSGSPSLVTLGPGAFPHRVGPPSKYGVKYVRYPRQALIRPQSQYFTSTIAGGLMSVPQQGNGAPNGYCSGCSSLAPQNYAPASDLIGNKVGGSPINGGASVTNVTTGVGFHGAPSTCSKGPGMLAVPLLRPPAGGRPGYAGAPPSAGPEGFQSSTTQRGSENLGSSHQTPHLRHNGTPTVGTGTPKFYPHPPMAGGALGTSSGRGVSHHSTPIGMTSTVQSIEEVPMTPRAPASRRHSFSRQPVFSAVEEMASSRSKSRRHLRPHH